MEPITLLSALLPVGVDFIKNVGGSLARRLMPKETEPRTFEEAVKLRELDLQHFKSMQEADAEGESYKWVEMLRKLQRPLIVYTTFIYFFTHYDLITPEFMENLVSSVVFYVFGDRSLHYIKRAVKGKG